jgi:hypothetical protein
MSTTILNNTDMMFLLSDYIDDKTAVNLFNTQRSYRSMIERFPKRYNKKKQLLYSKLEDEMAKRNGEIWAKSSKQTTLFVKFNMGEWNENCVVDLDDNGEVCMSTDQCMLAWFKEERKYKSDVELKRAFKNFFDC